jgi:hypothetical protein
MAEFASMETIIGPLAGSNDAARSGRGLEWERHQGAMHPPRPQVLS